jgi:hypothetical protein
MSHEESAELPKFHAVHAGPPRLLLYIFQDPPGPYAKVRLAKGKTVVEEKGVAPGGWNFVVNTEKSDGGFETIRDINESLYEKILMYPDEFVPRTTVWIDEQSGQPVDIYGLSFPGLA